MDLNYLWPGDIVQLKNDLGIVTRATYCRSESYPRFIVELQDGTWMPLENIRKRFYINYTEPIDESEIKVIYSPRRDLYLFSKYCRHYCLLPKKMFCRECSVIKSQFLKQVLIDDNLEYKVQKFIFLGEQIQWRTPRSRKTNTNPGIIEIIQATNREEIRKQLGYLRRPDRLIERIGLLQPIQSVECTIAIPTKFRNRPDDHVRVCLDVRYVMPRKGIQRPSYPILGAQEICGGCLTEGCGGCPIKSTLGEP